MKGRGKTQDLGISSPSPLLCEDALNPAWGPRLPQTPRKEGSAMSHASRQLHPGYCYHVTMRCNNREFRLTRFECREWLLYSLQKCQAKYGFKLYGLCIMSNHVHYLLEPQQPNDLPRIMHWLNWYTAMGFNRMLNRSGHF